MALSGLHGLSGLAGSAAGPSAPPPGPSASITASVDEGSPSQLLLDASASGDPAGLGLTYAWSSDAGAALADPSAAATTADYAGFGPVADTIRLTVADARAATDTTTLAVTWDGSALTLD